MNDSSNVVDMLNKYPYLKKMTNFTLFIDKDEFDNIINSQDILIGDTLVKEKFLNNIIKNYIYYDYALKYFLGLIDNFNVSYINNGVLGGSVYYNKATIIRGIEKLILDNKLNLTFLEKRRFNKLKSIINFNSMLNDFKDGYYKIIIDDIEYLIKYENIFDILNLNDENFKDFCDNDDYNVVSGIYKEHLVYAIIKFIDDYKIFDNYLVPDSYLKRYSEICSMQLVDIEAVNKFLIIADTKYKGVEIDNDFVFDILDGFPDSASKLEQVIYIYIKLCKKLTYDDEYYAVNQEVDPTDRHRNLDNVSCINSKNNKVVCYEFNMIFAKFLDMLNLNFKSNYLNNYSEAYGKGHVFIEFRCGKFLVRADSVTSILHGDLMQAKINLPLNGIVCLNTNNNTQEEFKNAYFNMYNLVINQENSLDNNNDNLEMRDIDNLMFQYSFNLHNFKDVSLEKRLSILINKVNGKGLIGIDALSYLLMLSKNIFSEEERLNNIKFNIIRNNNPLDHDKYAMASLIISLNKDGFNGNKDENVYFYYNPNEELLSISLDDLESRFNVGTFDYIESTDKKIPGIKVKKLV